MKKFLSLFSSAILAILVLATFSSAVDKTIYYRQGLTGGATTDLDEKDGTTLLDLDGAIVFDGLNVYFYYLNASSGAAENPPDVISPDTNAGTKRWILQTVYSVVTGITPPSGVEITDNIVGLYSDNDPVDTAHDVLISVGSCLDSTGEYLISLSTEMTKQIDGAWSAGDNSPGLLNGTVAANELYNIFALRKTSDASVDIGFLDKDDAIATYLPSGYAEYRWIGFVVTDASANVRQFGMNYKYYTFATGFVVSTALNTSSSTVQDFSAFMPAGHTRAAHMGIGYNSATTTVEFNLDGSSEPIDEFSSVSGTTTWSFIKLFQQSGTKTSGWTDVNLDGTVYINTNSVAVDIYLKQVEFIR